MKKLTLLVSMLLIAAGSLMAQRSVVGKVTDASGDPLPGATVLAKGTSEGTTADDNGNYKINVPANANTLVVSYTGFNTQEIVLGASNVVNITMQEGVTLSETVVTALGISKAEKSIGYAISSVDGGTVTRSGEVNVIQGLASKAAGVNVISSAGTPGASSKITLRGNSSFSLSNQPLIVIDNVPFDNSTNTVSPGDYPFNANLQGVNESNRGFDLASADIENISILKGPAASALYGTRAASGAILITTKKGKKGLTVDFGSSYSFDQVNKLPDLQNTYGQGSGGGTFNSDGTVKAEGSFTTYVPGVSNGTPNSWGPKIGSTQTPTAYDNADAYFQTGNTFSNNLSVSGGTDKSTFRFSYSRADQTGIIQNTSLERNTFRLSGATGTDVLKVSGSVAYSLINDSKAQNGSNLSGVMLPLLRTPASFNLIGGTGTGGYENLDGSQHTYIVNYDNPLWTAYHNPNTSDVGRFTGSASVDYTPTNWLTLTYRIGTDMYNDARKQIFDLGSNNNGGIGEIWEANIKHQEINQDFLARFTKGFGDINSSLVLGTQLNKRTDKSLFARGQNLTIPNFFNLANATNLYADQSSVTRKLAGMFASLDLDYKNWIYLNISARNDWASTFGPKAKNSFLYPSASLAFVPTEIMNPNDVLSYMKLRLSYAQAGREPNAYSSATYYGKPTFTDGFTDGISFPYLGNNGFSVSNTLGNTELRPEINTTMEFGADFKFLKNRITLGFTYYDSKATDLLIARPIASSTGFAALIANSGEMTNKGIELELGLDVVKTKSFNWNIQGNFSRNKNEVTKLVDGVEQFSIEAAFTGIGSYAIVGQPFGAIFGSTWQRNDAGSLIIGSNGLPLKNAEDQYIGNPYPDWISAIRNTFTFKGFSLTGLLDIRQGGDLWGGTIGRLNRIGVTAASANRTEAYVIPGVKADGTPNDIKISPNAYFSQYIGDGGGAQESLVYDGSWVRLREVTLTYTLPKFKKLIQSASVYVTGRNLWLQTDYPGVDPETSLTGAGSNIGGFDYFNMPGSKSIIVGLNIGF
jgi:TonB-linked SusC/RagA family outer membrane protein